MQDSDEQMQILLDEAIARYSEFLTDTALRYARGPRFRKFYFENMAILLDETLTQPERNLKLSRFYGKRSRKETSLLAVLLQNENQTSQDHIDLLASLFPAIKK